jgi:hypothetical protein
VPPPDGEPDPEVPDPDVREPVPDTPEPDDPDDPDDPEPDPDPDPDPAPDEEPDPVVPDPDSDEPCPCPAPEPLDDVEPVPPPTDLNWESAAFAVCVWVPPEEIATPAAIGTATTTTAPIAATIDQRNLRDPRACPDGSFTVPTFVRHSLRALTR